MPEEIHLSEGPNRDGLNPEHSRARTKATFIDIEARSWQQYKRGCSAALDAIQATDDDLQQRADGSSLLPSYGRPIFPVDNAVIRMVNMARDTHARGNKVMFAGNGGSNSIASHMAVDWTKNGGIRSVAPDSAAFLTCVGNDFGYENVFVKWLEYYADEDDLVIIVSSSGRSPNVVKTGQWCRENRVRAITISGFDPDQNLLRRLGKINFWVPSGDYGRVELASVELLHSVVSAKW